MHQPVELPAGDFRGPGERGAGCGQCGARQTGRADAVDCGPRRSALPPGRRAEGGLAAHAWTGETVGASIVGDPRIAGVAFTGSVETARAINRTLAGRAGPIAPLIAETGGLNAMIVDSTALPEQVVADVIASAFQSAGQRCSSLRLLCLQEEIAGRVIDLLAGAMSELRIGDPSRPETDLGPVIDCAGPASAGDIPRSACAGPRGRFSSWRCRRTARTETSSRLAPTRSTWRRSLATKCSDPSSIVIRYRREDLDRVLDAIGGTGFGADPGNPQPYRPLRRGRAQPAAGREHLHQPQHDRCSGRSSAVRRGGACLAPGPKAGGPRYLQRFAVERTVTINTAAAGGNASLLAEIG